VSAVVGDPLATLAPAARATLSAVADRLIPAARGMPSAGDVLGDDRLRFVLNARPDLLEPLAAALGPALGDDVQARLDALGRDEPATLAALQLVIVAGYYTDRHVRELIGYPGQMALDIRSWQVPAYLDEGLVDALLARGPSWRDPATGTRAVATDAPKTYAERWATASASAEAEVPEGGDDGDDRT
jgi:hypothetical protein